MVKPGACTVAHLSACEFPVHALQRALALRENAEMMACKT